MWVQVNLDMPVEEWNVFVLERVAKHLRPLFLNHMTEKLGKDHPDLPKIVLAAEGVWGCELSNFVKKGDTNGGTEDGEHD